MLIQCFTKKQKKDYSHEISRYTVCPLRLKTLQMLAAQLKAKFRAAPSPTEERLHAAYQREISYIKNNLKHAT